MGGPNDQIASTYVVLEGGPAGAGAGEPAAFEGLPNRALTPQAAGVRVRVVLEYAEGKGAGEMPEPARSDDRAEN